jgi:hypothetical protein
LAGLDAEALTPSSRAINPRCSLSSLAIDVAHRALLLSPLVSPIAPPLRGRSRPATEPAARCLRRCARGSGARESKQGRCQIPSSRGTRRSCAGRRGVTPLPSSSWETRGTTRGCPLISRCRHVGRRTAETGPIVAPGPVAWDVHVFECAHVAGPIVFRAWGARHAMLCACLGRGSLSKRCARPQHIRGNARQSPKAGRLLPFPAWAL